MSTILLVLRAQGGLLRLTTHNGARDKIGRLYSVLNKEIKETAKLIIDAHDGKGFYELGEVADIVGIHRNHISHKLHHAGITIKKVGPKKIISANDIAAFMCEGRIAPIDNTSRGARSTFAMAVTDESLMR